MGSLVSPIVANLYMEQLEREALRSVPTPPRHWFSMWMTPSSFNKHIFMDHINSIDLAKQFTVKGNQDNGAIPFLDTLVTPQTDHSLSITIYHKPTHTDQYLQWNSNHNLSAKYSVIGNLPIVPIQCAPHQSFLMRSQNTSERPW